LVLALPGLNPVCHSWAGIGRLPSPDAEMVLNRPGKAVLNYGKIKTSPEAGQHKARAAKTATRSDRKNAAISARRDHRSRAATHVPRDRKRLGRIMVAAAELSYSTNASAMQMAQTIFGDGVTVVSATYTGDKNSSATYSGGDSISPGVTPGDTGVILSTGKAKDFTNSKGQANQNSDTTTDTGGIDNNSQFNAAAGTNTYDASFLDVNFIPTSDVMTMRFVFSSEEYPEFQNSLYQDFVGVWINGVQVDLSIGNGDVDPGNLNNSTNQNLFVNNMGDAFNTEMDGFTVTMTLKMKVIVGVVNSIRIGIADVTDSSYDSNLLIAGDSVQTAFVALDDDTTLHPTGTRVLDVLANDGSGASTLTITHINGIPVTVGSTVTLSTGQTVKLNADGTLTITGDGDTEKFNFTYTVSDGTNIDTAFVKVDSVPCFVAGTLIATPDGEHPVETLRPGDLVLTRDNGPQPLRWIGSRTIAATGDLAPIHIRAGSFGDHRDLSVSPQHRVLIEGPLAELLFGEAEVLVAAADLVNDGTVTRAEGGNVTYVHLLFDRHEVITSEGLATESFLPGPRTTALFDRPLVEEICRLFPQLDPTTGRGYGDAARRILRRFETLLLTGGLRAAA
jgi:hypothetical protein